MNWETNYEQLWNSDEQDSVLDLKKFDNIQAVPQDVKKIKNKIEGLLYCAIFRDLNQYRELFVGYDDEISTDKFVKKVLFKLEKIIRKQINLGEYKIFIQPTGNAKFFGDQTYSLPLEIFLIDNKAIVANWTQDFIYINYLQGRAYFEKFSILDQARKFILSINKSMFDQKKWKSSKNLFWFIKGALEEISGDFKVTPRWDNLHLPLEGVDFQIHVYWKSNWTFDATIGWNSTKLFFYNKDNQKDIYRSEQSIPDKLKVEYDQGIVYSRDIFKQMTADFEDCWDLDDTIGEAIKTAKYLLYKKFGEVAKYISITTNKSPKTKFKQILNGDIPDFNWYIIFHGSSTIIFPNQKYKVIKVKHLNMALEVPKLIQQIFVNVSFPNDGITLQKIINWELSKLSYLFTTSSKYNNLQQKLLDIDFYLYVYYNDLWLCDINLYLKWHGWNWIIKFFHNENDKWLKVKDEL